MELNINGVRLSNVITGVIGGYNNFLESLTEKKFFYNKVLINENVVKKDERIKLLNKIAIIDGIKIDYNFTVYEYMKYVIFDEFLSIKNYDKKIKDSLKIVGIDDELLDRKISSLSYSESRLISLATGLLKNPEVIVFDNFFNGLDLNSTRNIFKLLERLTQRYNKSILIFSKNVDFIYQYSKEVVVFSNNKLILHGSCKDVFENNNDILKKNNILIPKTVLFTNKVNKLKKKKLKYNVDIRDLIKDIYKKV